MLERIEQRVGAQVYLYPLDLTLVPNAVTVLLGATQAGKTTLMRVMAGLDAPAKGRVKVDGHDVTGKSVRERNVAMVYQQFINYPSMTVADNIASPLKLLQDALRQTRRRRTCQRARRQAAHQSRSCGGCPPSCRAASSSAWRCARAGQERAADAARRAACEPGLQTARGAAR